MLNVYDKKWYYFLETNSITGQAPSLKEYTEKLVKVCIDVYHTVSAELLPTPAKSHYTFNLRDLSKVFQGMLMLDSSKMTVSEISIDFIILCRS